MKFQRRPYEKVLSIKEKDLSSHNAQFTSSRRVCNRQAKTKIDKRNQVIHCRNVNIT